VTIYNVDLACRVIPADHKAFIARPGRDSRLFRLFDEASAIGPELPYLGLADGTPLSEYEDIEERVKRAIAVRNWHPRRQPEFAPARDLESYTAQTNVRSLAQHVSIVRGYFEKASKGDFAIVTPKAFGEQAKIVEFIDDPESRIEIAAPDFFGDDPLTARRVRTLARVPKGKLPVRILDILSKPSALVLLEKSEREAIYNLALSSFFMEGTYSVRFDVEAEDYNTDDDILLKAFIKFVTANTVATAITHDNAVMGIKEATFAPTAGFSSELRTSINSPGFIELVSKNLIPAAVAALFALAVQVGPSAVQAAKENTIVFGNSQAGPDDPCTAPVSETVLLQLRLLGLDKWSEACQIARQVEEKADLKGSTTVTREE